MMVKLTALLIIFSWQINTLACLKQQCTQIRAALISSLGKEWYNRFSSDATHGFLLTVGVDASGKIIEIKSYGLRGGITEEEFKKFIAVLQKEPLPCIRHSDPHASLESYFESGNGQVAQSFTFWPLKINAFLDKQN